MTRVVYVNGRYLPYRAASLHVEDRGFLFADGVYEVFPVHEGRILDEKAHFARLRRSLRELLMKPPMGFGALAFVMEETRRQNRVSEGYLYLQMTRGVAPRAHEIPRNGKKASLVIFARRLTPAKREKKREGEGISVITLPDIRWKRCDIKSTALLANVLLKEKARRAHADDAWFVNEKGRITEGSSSNAWIITKAGVLRTHPAGSAILEGVTRKKVLQSAQKMGVTIEESAFSRADALKAEEAFITSSTQGVMPVLKIDGHHVGKGIPGAITKELAQRHASHRKKA